MKELKAMNTASADHSEVGLSLHQSVTAVMQERTNLAPGYLDLCAREVVTRFLRDMAGSQPYISRRAVVKDRNRRMQAAYVQFRAKRPPCEALRLVARRFDVSERTARRVCL